MGFPVVGAGRFHSLLWKTPVEREIESELDFHLEMRVRDYVERGMAPEAARAAALARLGNLDRVRVECRRLGRLRDRDLRRAERFAELRQDLRLACRRHLASPVFASLSIVTLALALAAATVAFAACDALVFGPLLFPAPDRLVRLREIDSQGNDLAVSRLDYLDWRQSGESLVALAALLPARRGLTLPNGERVVGVEATASLFSVLGLHAARGALLSTADERRGRPHDAVVLSDRLWRRLGGDPDLLGQMLSLDGRPYRVRGVLPAAVAFPPGVDLWVPLLLDLGPARQPSRDRHDLAVVGRLRPRVGPAAAARGLARLASPATPGSGQRGGVRVTPLADWVVGEGPRVRVLLALGAALLLGLLAGCCIVNLLISRAEGRQRELALRAALGASRGRILRQLTTEGALLALLAAALALPFATAALELVRTRFAELAGTAGMAGRGLATSFAAARLAGLAWNDRAAGVFAVAAAAAALAVGLVPALAATRGRRPSLGRRHLRDVLVVTEIAVATTLLVGSGLTARSYLRLRTADPGFAATSLVTAELDLTGERFPPAVRRTLSPALEARLARVPGVRAVGSTSFAPWSGKRTDPPFLVTWRPPGQPVRTLAAEWRSVSPGFFPTLGIPLLAGRLPRVDTANTPDTPEIEIAVDRTLARRWWPAGGALGERLELGNPGRPVRVVGIVGAIADVSLDTAPRPTVFLPYPRRPWRTLTLVAQAAGDPTRVARAVRREITAFDPDLPLVDVGPLARNRTAALAAPRASLLVLVLFAILALALAGIGVYDLLAAGVDERTPEIAVRMALGAPPRGVLRLVLYRGLLLAGFGLGLGLIAAAWLARFLPTILYATSPTDVLSYVIPALLLVGMALAAGLLPARRATRITPAAVLKGP